METVRDSSVSGETAHDRASDRTGEDSAKLFTICAKIAIYKSTIAELTARLETTCDTMRASPAERARTLRWRHRLKRTKGLLERAEYRRQIITTEEAAFGGVLERYRKYERDLLSGLSNLHAMRPKPHDLESRLLEQGAKLRSVQNKIFGLRQGRFL